MLSLTAEFEVEKSIQDVWNFFMDFDNFARYIPTLKEYKVTDPVGLKGEGKVGIKLGAIPVESRLVMQVTEKRDFECIKAEGYSFLGETLVEQIRSGKAMEGVDKGSVGKLMLHVDLRPGENGKTKVIYQASVEAEGRLRKIYDAIMKLKSKSLQKEFEESIKKGLNEFKPETAAAPAPPTLESVSVNGDGEAVSTIPCVLPPLQEDGQ